jgi:hypothetical protein
MSRIAQRILFALPAAYAASLFVSATAFAAPVVTKSVQSQATVPAAQLGALDLPEAAPVAEVAPVVAKNEALSPDATEVQPSDWQYTALQGLMSKYNCGGLDGTAVSRDSFVDGLNSCLKKVEPMLAKNSSSVSAEELDVLRRLTQEFRAELSNLDTRVATVQQRTALVQNSQFSTTTKLKGEVIVGANGVFAGGGPGSNVTVGSRARLLLESTFTGKDRLYTRLSAANAGGYGRFKNDGPTAIPTSSGSEANQTYFGGINGRADNSINLDWLAYQFPVGNASVYAAAVNGIHSDYADTHSPYFQDFTGGSGAISLLAEENPIYKIGGGTGLGITVPLNGANTGIGLDSINLSYFAGATTANSPANSAGLFGGRNSFFAQVNFKPSEKFDFGLTYVNAYHAGGAIYDFGSGGAVVGSAATGGPLPGTFGPVGFGTSNSYGLSAAYKASDNLSLNGYITNTSASPISGAPNADIWTYGVGVALPNIGQPGNLLGFFVGQAPTVTNNPGLASSAYHIEGFYKYKLNDNVSITPGLIYLTNPNQQLTGGEGALVGTVRTTFTF